MADITRTADAVWQGESRTGKGRLTTPSGAFQDEPYTWAGRFETGPGTSPEELIAAAHAGCFTMALASTLGKKGTPPTELRTRCIITMEKTEAGNSVTRSRLEVEGEVPNIDQAAFQQAAEEAKNGCPISRLLRPGLKEIQLAATLK